MRTNRNRVKKGAKAHTINLWTKSRNEVPDASNQAKWTKIIPKVTVGWLVKSKKDGQKENK